MSVHSPPQRQFKRERVGPRRQKKPKELIERMVRLAVVSGTRLCWMSFRQGVTQTPR